MAIDHQKRRRDIAEIAIGLIAREGLEAASVRRIAAEAGFSTTAITHYFGDKHDLLTWTFEVLSTEGERRFEEALGDDGSPVDALLTMLPWCPANVRRWKAYLAFWDQAARDPVLAAQITASTETGLRFIEQLLRSSAGPQVQVESATRLLNAVVQGLAMQCLVNETYWTPERLKGALREALKDLAGLDCGAAAA